MTEMIYGIVVAAALFAISSAMILNAAGKGATRLMATVSMAFVLKLFLVFGLLFAVKKIFTDIPRNFVISLLTTYLLLLGLQLSLVLKKLKRIYRDENS